MIKKILLSALCLSMFSGDGQAVVKAHNPINKSKMSKAKGAKWALGVGTLAALYSIFVVRLARGYLKLRDINQHVLYNHEKDYACKELKNPKTPETDQKKLKRQGYWNGDDCYVEGRYNMCAHQIQGDKLKPVKFDYAPHGEILHTDAKDPLLRQLVVEAFMSPRKVVKQGINDARALGSYFCVSKSKPGVNS